MKIIKLFIFAFIISIFGCSGKSEFTIRVENNMPIYDSLFIRDLVTNQLLVSIPLSDSEKEYKFPINKPINATIQVKESDISYITILKPNSKKIIVVDSSSLITKHDKLDSLANFILQNNNNMFRVYGAEIFGEDNPKRIRHLFDSIIVTRSKIINGFKNTLSKDDIEILEFENRTRAYNFLFFYGRWIRSYSLDNHFFNFIDSIKNNNEINKLSPTNLLYKYEVQFLRQNDSIPSINSFLSFIEKQTKNEDLQDFLKAIYIKEVIEHPQYWKRHRQLFTTPSIKLALDHEKDNKYSSLISTSTNSYFHSQQGEKAFNFIAKKPDGSEVSLFDLKGKLVLIDAWATWCAPCIDERPDMLKIAENFKDNNKITILMISVERSIEKWKKYIAKTNPENLGIELIIEDGLNSEFGKKYFIKSIPKYILIDHKGNIIDSDLNKPSPALEQFLKQELTKL
ncbi:MAG: TlpA family protein disulfide reductase [Cyclobacteriaceae bacterium]|nr:TlpA family protein disulfide reductase [Cyclobacteriaceae bacterium]